MKIIELLNRIANNEGIPKKIKWEDTIYSYSDYDKDYLEYPFSEEEYQGLFNMKDSILTQYLNEEVEVVEEEQEDKKIRKIKTEYSPDIEEEIFYVDGNKPNHCILGDNGTKLIINKINEIIDKINKEKNNENN